MDFDIRYLSVLNYAQGFTFWHYKAKKRPDLNQFPNFFGAAADMINPGDCILITGPWGGIQVISVEVLGRSSQDMYVNVTPLAATA